VSEENVEIVRRTIEAVNGGSIAEDCFDANVEYHPMPAAPVPYAYRGVEGVRDGLLSLQEAWSEMKVEATRFIEAGDTVVALIRYEVRGRGSGVTMEGEQAWAFWFRKGLICRVDQYAGEDDALKAVGPEQ
jgi:ketosteroid isomerase-like protein